MRAFGEESLKDPAYIQLCLANFTLTHEHITGLLKNAFEDPYSLNYRYLYLRSKPLPDQPSIDFSISSNIVFAILYFFSLLSAIDRESKLRHYQIKAGTRGEIELLVSYRNPDLPLINYITAFLTPVYKLLQNLNLTHQQINLVPYLDVFYWIIKFIIEPKTIELVDAFILSYAEMRIDYPWLSSLLRQYGEIIHPFFPLLIRAIDLESLEMIEDVRNLILQLNNVQKYTESFYLIRDFIEFAQALLSWDQLVAITLFGVWVSINELGREQFELELRKQFHIGLDTLMELTSSISMTEIYNIKIEPEVIGAIFEEIYNSIERNIDLANLPLIIRKLNAVASTSKDLLNSKSLELLLILIEKIEVNPKAISLAIATHFLTSSNIKDLPENIVISALQCLGNNKALKFDNDLYGVYYSVEHIKFILPNLEAFLHHSYAEIAEGAVILTSIFIDNLLLNLELGRTRSPMFNNLTFDLKKAIKLIRNKNPELKIIGIKLLTFSSVLIENEGAELLQDIFFCKDDREAEVWSNFIKYSGYTQRDSEPASLTAWIDFFERILGRRANVMPKIAKSVLEKYSTLIISQDSEITLDEKALGLPLTDEE